MFMERQEEINQVLMLVFLEDIHTDYGMHCILGNFRVCLFL